MIEKNADKTRERLSVFYVIRAVLLCCVFVVVLSCARKATPLMPKEPEVVISFADAELDGSELLSALSDISRIAKEKPPGTLQTLCRLSSHPDHLVRIRAVKALSEEPFRSTDDSNNVFISSLSDSHWLVRSFAVRGLALAARPESFELLQAAYMSEPHERVRARMSQALLKLEQGDSD